jgi:hypothetical protein
VSRKTLLHKIQLQNERLDLRQAQFILARARSKRVLSRCNPYLIIGVGLLAGVATKALGWRKVYSLAKVGARLYPLITNGVKPNDE